MNIVFNHNPITCLAAFILLSTLSIKPSAAQTTVCENDTVYLTCSGYTGTIQWQQSADSVLWTDITGATGDTLMIIASNDQFYRARVIDGTCQPVYSEITTIIVNGIPDAANAGPDQTLACNATTATLAGNTPVTGTGLWSVVSGTATITNPASPNSGVTGLTLPGTAVLRWTISNPPCPQSTDEVVITSVPCPPFVCGDTLHINHVMGAVAPESKQVSYGTVMTNLSGANKCWITQNLGASTQASSATDTTNAAAGWYWQFNRMQGYRNGSPSPTTPGWPTVSISEPSDWTAANDPCAIELGTGWRIPTQAEWTNADANGSWSSGAHAYNSVLKLHAAGLIYGSPGVLYSRGGDGSYWSSTSYSNSSARYLGFGSSYSYMVYDAKTYGNTLRCIKD
jgi:hypothetical protein